MAEILVVDDEAAIADLVEVCLKNEGYTVYKCGSGEAALTCVARQHLDLAILDVMLPDLDGFTLCQKIREEHLFPILMLTARVEDMDKIMGLTLGADDYITKPFNPLELVARVKTQLRRYTRYNTAEAAELIGGYDIVDATVAEKALPYCNIVCVTGTEMMDMLSGYLSVLWEQDAESVGGGMPNDDFYYGA